MERELRVAWLPAVLLAIAPSVAAGQLEHSVAVGPIPVGGSATATLPQFDGSLGVLRLVHIEVASRVSGTLGFENLTNQPVSVGGYTAGHNLGMLVPVSFQSVPIMNLLNPAFIPPAVALAPFDGTTDYAGPSGVFHVFTDETADGYPSGTADMYTDTPLQAFSGSGTVGIVLGPTYQSGPDAPIGVVATGTVAADATVRVRYEYDAFPAAICRVQFASGCPCAAPPTGRGCANSVNPTGGALSTAGTASISNDTLVLNGEGMTPSSSALYFQGTTMQHAQIVYGDGLRCVTGNVVRLGTKMNAGGASSYPAGGDPAVSVRGVVTSPGTRYYQVSYRDLGDFCTPAPFNITSGVAVTWTL
jgi:hypothetical protein